MRLGLARSTALLMVAATAVVPIVGSAAGAESEAVTTSTVAGSPSAGCGTSEIATGIVQVDFEWEGESRFYVRRVPPAHDGVTPLPIVFDFHGLSEGAAIHQVHSQFGEHGDEHGYVTIFPQARGIGLNVSWATGLGSVDVAMFGEMLDQLEADLCLDTDRVYVTGLSQGGFMSSSIACAYADRVAAIAPVAGLRNPAGCAPSRPIPVLNFHGTADTIVSYAPIPGFTAAWAARNGCGPDPSTTFVGEDDVATVDLVEYDCPADATVAHYRITGGGHSWPGSDLSVAIGVIVGYTTFVIDATDLIWQFFEGRTLPVTTGSVSGRVLDGANAPFAGAAVWAYAESDTWVGSYTTTTAEDGGYELSLPPGDYRILFHAPGTDWVSEWWHHSSQRSPAGVIRVTAGATSTGVDGKLAPGGSVHGRVTDPDGVGVGGAEVWLYTDTDTWVGSVAAVTGSDGTYRVRAVASGEYRVMVRAPEGSGLDHQWRGGFSMSQRWESPTITLGWNQVTTGVDAQLAAAP